MVDNSTNKNIIQTLDLALEVLKKRLDIVKYNSSFSNDAITKI